MIFIPEVLMINSTDNPDLYCKFCLKPTFEFHINTKSRDKYLIDEVLFSITGSIIFINFSSSRELARQMNLTRDADSNTIWAKKN